MKDKKRVEIGLRIREIRVTANLTQSEFAEKVGTTSSGLSQIERGVIYPSLDILSAVIMEFKQSYSWVIDGTQDLITLPYVNTNDPLEVQCSNLFFGQIVPLRDNIARVEAYLLDNYKELKVSNQTSEKMEKTWQSTMRQYFTDLEDAKGNTAQEIYVYSKYKNLFLVFLMYFKDRLITVSNLLFSFLSKDPGQSSVSISGMDALIDSILEKK